MYRQNIVLNDFVNFLKARGRFREIEFIDNSVHATPRIPDFPSLVFYIEEDRSEQYYTLEIHGNESPVMNREIQEFFNLNQLGLTKIKIKYHLTTSNSESLIIETEGLGSAFEDLEDQIITLFDAQQYSITTTQKTLVFSSHKKDSRQQQPLPKRDFISQAKTQSTPPRMTMVSTQKPDKIRSKLDNVSALIPKDEPQLNHLEEDSKAINEILDPSFSSATRKSYPEPIDTSSSSGEREEEIFDVIKEKQDKSQKEEEVGFNDEIESENSEMDLFHAKAPDKSYPDDLKPYLKQTTSLFRRDNWEEDLPTELEMEILERTFMRIKHRTKPEILAKDMNFPLDLAETYLRNLISKGLLRTQVGWYIIKKSHLPFFKRTFSDGEKKKKKKKSPRISRVGEGLTPEEISTIKAIKSRPNLKAQSNLLTRPTGLKQSVLKEVLRNLVDKGILRVSYGWYILKDKNILEHKRGASLGIVDESQKFKMPKELDLTNDEEKVIQALLQRPQYKAQSNLLTSDVKLPKDQIKQVLRELLEKDICKVTYGWYMLKNPERFLPS
ncbi:MAG: hypothetical protein ACXAC8_00630 [Candidatus Hodarchaeales archaeon]